VCVAEGDNFLLPQQVTVVIFIDGEMQWFLCLQTTRFLLKMLQKTISGESDALPEQTSYLKDAAFVDTQKSSATCPSDFRSVAVQLSAFRHRALRLVVTVAEAVQQHVGEGRSLSEATNSVQWEVCCCILFCSVVSFFIVQVIRASDAHCLLSMLACFCAAEEGAVGSSPTGAA
jgi:hypothetical protein